MKHRIFSLNDHSLTIELDSKISVETNDRVLQLSRFFDENPFEGFIESIPAYSSLTIFYDVPKVRSNSVTSETAFAIVSALAEEALGTLIKAQPAEVRLVEIPVCFDEEFAPDLEFLAVQNNLSPEEVIKIFLGKEYRIFMLGFLPGFAYMGEVDEIIAVPRKQTPRLKIPAGSVGIAGRQTGIYPSESPGGWQIIGKTPRKLFTPESDSPTLLNVGDQVKFIAITKENFNGW